MSQLIVVRSGPEFFIKAAMNTASAQRATRFVTYGGNPEGEFRTEQYVALKNNDLQGAMRYVVFPEDADMCFIDFLGVSQNAGPEVRGLLLEMVEGFGMVVADPVAAPSLVAVDGYELVGGDVFVRSNRYTTAEEVSAVCQMYQSRVSSLYTPPDLRRG